jgi:hypothetical protein
MILIGFNSYKFIKREKTRFFDLSESIKYINDVEYNTNLLIFFNSILSTENQEIYEQIKIDIINLKIVEEFLKKININDKTFELQLQILTEDLSSGIGITII